MPITPGGQVVTVKVTPPPVIHLRVGPVGSQGPPGPAGADGADANWLSISQADYDLLAPPDPNTLYVITS